MSYRLRCPECHREVTVSGNLNFSGGSCYPECRQCYVPMELVEPDNFESSNLIRATASGHTVRCPNCQEAIVWPFWQRVFPMCKKCNVPMRVVESGPRSSKPEIEDPVRLSDDPITQEETDHYYFLLDFLDLREYFERVFYSKERKPRG